MKKEYEAPRMEFKIICFADILTTSGNIPDTPPDSEDIWDDP